MLLGEKTTEEETRLLVLADPDIPSPTTGWAEGDNARLALAVVEHPRASRPGRRGGRDAARPRADPVALARAVRVPAAAVGGAGRAGARCFGLVRAGPLRRAAAAPRPRWPRARARSSRTPPRSCARRATRRTLSAATWSGHERGRATRCTLRPSRGRRAARLAAAGRAPPRRVAGPARTGGRGRARARPGTPPGAEPLVLAARRDPPLETGDAPWTTRRIQDARERLRGEVHRVVVGHDAVDRPHARGAALRGARAARGRARHGQDAARPRPSRPGWRCPSSASSSRPT